MVVLRYKQGIKKKVFFPGCSQRKTKQRQQAKKWLRKWHGLKQFKPCDIWFHGDGLSERQEPEHEKANSLPRMQHHGGPGSFPTPWVQTLMWAEGLQAQQDILHKPCEVGHKGVQLK